jgi:serine phosphatase RsbU (regulator of sigma subunit)
MPRDRTTRSAPRGLFELIPRRSVVVFLAAVFFVFAPTHLLLGARFQDPPPLRAALLLAVLSGAVAVSWAATFTVARRLAWAIVVLTILLMGLSGPLAWPVLGIQPRALSPSGLTIVASIVSGYVLFVAFINNEGRRTVRLMTEMALAQRIHASLVPAIERSDEWLEVHAVSSPSSEMGGDLVDLVDRGDTTDLVLADVSGHGVKAGVVMGMLKSALRMGLRDGRSLDRLAGDLNDVLEQTTSAEMYATLALLRLHHAERKLECVVAGHSPLLLLRCQGGAPARIGEGGLPVGLMPGREYEVRVEPLAAGDLIAVWTDGLDETADAAGRELGRPAIERAIVERAEGSLAEIRHEVFERVRAHGPQRDDRSLLLVRIGGAPRGQRVRCESASSSVEGAAGLDVPVTSARARASTRVARSTGTADLLQLGSRQSPPSNGRRSRSPSRRMHCP